MREPSSIITIGKTIEPRTISLLLQKFDTSYYDYSLIKVNGKKVKRDDRIIFGGDIVSLFKKEE